MAILFGNNAASTLTVSLFSGDTTIIIDAADMNEFPVPVAPDYFLVTVEDLKQTPVQREICKCTGRVGNLLTVVRGFEGFPPLDFAVGTATVSNRVTAATMSMAMNVWPPADSKVYGTKMVTAGGAPQFVEVLTTQGTLNFSGPIGVGMTPPAGVAAASISTGDLFINGNLAFNAYWSPTSWKYRVAGAAALITFDPTLATPVLTFNTAATGAAGATPNFLPALRADTKGNLAGLNVSFVPANAATVTWSPPPVTFDLGSWLSWNLYIATDSAWRTKAAGYSAMVHFDNASGYLNFFVNPSTGSGGAPALTHVLRLDTNQGLTAVGRVYATAGVSFSSYNSWEWTSYTDGSGNHIQAHRASWYDLWASSNGTRSWVGNNASLMSLDGSGNLTVMGTVRGPTGVWATSDNALGLYTAASRWSVLQLNSDGWRLSYDRNIGEISYVTPGNVQLWKVDGAGNMTVTGSINTPTDISVRTLYASNAVVTPWLHSTGSIQVDAAINGSTNLNLAGDVHANAVFATAGVFANNDTTIGMYVSGNARFHQYAPTWYWQWDGANGNLIWHAGSQQHLVIRQTPDTLVYNQRSAMGGYGAYQNFSDRRAKTKIAPATKGLAEILLLEPVTFERIAYTPPEGAEPPVVRTEIGFIAQDVITVIPEAVKIGGMPLPDGTGTFEDPEPSLSMTYDTITATLVNAVKELAARVTALETPA